LKNDNLERGRSYSDTTANKGPTPTPTPTPQKPSVGKNSPVGTPPPDKPVPTPVPTVEHKPPPTTPAPSDNAQTGAVQPARPSALTSVIYPVLSKLLKQNQEEGVIASLAQLKIAFDNAERAKPGITHQLIAQIIETLKR